MILPGFYGKMPATGDFVTRRLPGDFVRNWDRWLAQHLVPLLGRETWPRTTALRFLAGPASFGASAGIILQSADRVGRQFPLSVVAQLPEVCVELAYADAWFAEIEKVAIAAQNGELTPDELDGALATLPAPPVEPGEELISDMVMWTARSDIFDIDPLSPQTTLEQIFAESWETSLYGGEH
ncbi:type VI secretion system-associated protein TagF [Mesorhizobium sp. M0622]